MTTATYRRVYVDGGKAAPWLAALRRSSGVYAVRDAWFGEVLYVGSSAGRLTKTILRHFQAWRRAKSFWAGFFGGGDPGQVYDRGAVEVAVWECDAAKVLELEAATIARLKPRDNQNAPAGEGGGDDAPF